jgi:hypothetical protein
MAKKVSKASSSGKRVGKRAAGARTAVPRVVPVNKKLARLTSTTVHVLKPDPLAVAEPCCDIKMTARRSRSRKKQPRDAFAYGYFVVNGIDEYVLATRNFGSTAAQLKAGQNCYGANLISSTWYEGEQVDFQEPYGFCENSEFQVVC